MAVVADAEDEGAVAQRRQRVDEGVGPVDDGLGRLEVERALERGEAGEHVALVGRQGRQRGAAASGVGPHGVGRQDVGAGGGRLRRRQAVQAVDDGLERAGAASQPGSARGRGRGTGWRRRRRERAELDPRQAGHEAALARGEQHPARPPRDGGEVVGRHVVDDGQGPGGAGVGASSQATSRPAARRRSASSRSSRLLPTPGGRPRRGAGGRPRRR
ncbi:MAG: hypothetical protein R3F59_02685 [Myxococcota bacterium]